MWESLNLQTLKSVGGVYFGLYNTDRRNKIFQDLVLSIFNIYDSMP